MNEEIIDSLKNKTVLFIRYIYGWISKDDEFLGHVLGVSHFIISATFYLLIIVCHVIYPSVYFQIFIFICLLIIWLQHILFKVCISILAEKHLTKVEAPSLHFFKIVLEWFGITLDDFLNYFIAAETTAISMFGLELLSKLSVYLYEKYNIIY
jgi:hypothetical protein